MESAVENGLNKKKCSSCGEWNLYIFVRGEMYVFLIKNI